MAAMSRYQSFLEKKLFKGKSTKASEALAYVPVNLFLMIVVFDLILNTAVYNWTGALYSSGFHLNTALDDAIPFDPRWAVFYLYLFYWATEATMAFLAVFVWKQGYALAWSLVLINLVADLVYLVFPVTTDAYRAAIAANPVVGSRFADAIYDYYKTDPSYNCLPSLHAAVSTAIAYAWYRFAKAKPGALSWALALVGAAIAVGTVLSTLFVKQHYIADEVAGVALALAVCKPVYDRLLGKSAPRPAKPEA